MSSLFRRVTRHRVGTTQDPRENRLTEITAAVLERVEGLALDVMETIVDSAATTAKDRGASATGDESSAQRATFGDLKALIRGLRALDEPRLRIGTQRTTASGKFVDLELRFSPQPFQPGETVTFWVEVKHGAGVHGTQLDDYVTDIALEAADHRLVLVLAPRQSTPDVPGTMAVATWQAVADVVRRWTARTGLGEVERFLLIDYLAYLAEEGLMDEELLTAEHAFVLRAEPTMSATVARLVELVDDYVTDHWGPRVQWKGGQRQSYGTDYWAHYALHRTGTPEVAAQWRSATFEWGLRLDTSRDAPRNAWVFVAGATFLTSKDSPATVADNAKWLADRRKDDFEYVNDWYWRLFRFRYPEELLVATTLDDQVELLGAWVVESFDLLAAAPPPH